MKRVLVTDGESRPALAIVRSLGKAGFAPFVCAQSARSLAGASRFACGAAAVPDPLSEPAKFVDAVLRLVGEWGIDMVQPVSEPAHIAILGAADRFSGVRLPPGTLDSFLALTDKSRVLAAAAGAGLAAPEQIVVDRPCSAVAAAFPAFPVVVKPARTVSRGMLHTVQYAEDREALVALLDRLSPNAFPVLVQRRIFGSGAAVSLLRWHGELVAAFAHRRIREHPASGGASVVSESVSLDDVLVERSLALLDAFDWNGVAMVEFKIEGASGQPWLMEVNPRFWGSVQLAVDCGVDFPVLLARCVLEGGVAPAGRYRTGRRLRHWLGDLDRLTAQLRHPAQALSLPPGAPGRVRAATDFLLPRRRQRPEIWRFGDLRPFFLELRLWLERRHRRRRL